MPTTCTCGANLPEDARFCHRCGKPQRDEPVFSSLETERVVDLPSATVSISNTIDSRVTFSDPLTLRSCLLVASVTTVLALFPFAIFVLPLLGGFASVALYRRRSGHLLNVGEGAKLGWITAVMSYLLLTIFLTLTVAVSGSGLETLRQQLRSQMTDAAEQQIVNAPWFLGVAVVLAWLIFFAFASVLSVIGGALGARFRREKAS